MKNNSKNLNKKYILQIIEKYQTPLWIYDSNIIKDRILQLKKFDSIRFAQKACSNIHILKFMKENNVKVDAVSEGEIERAIYAGYNPEKDIVFTSDLFESNKLIKKIVSLNITVNIGSINMLEQLGKLSLGHKIWLRINPKFGYGHNEKTNTGGENSKHGIWNIQKSLYYIKKYKFKLVGIHMHIGSGINFNNLKKVCKKMIETIFNFKQKIKFISTGGGLSIPYKLNEKKFNVDNFFNIWDKTRKKISQYIGNPIKLEIEPGRFLVAESGILVSKVRSIKKMGKKKYTLVNVGFNELIRPVLYSSYHHISIIKRNKEKSKKMEKTIIGGPLCESGDIFTQTKKKMISHRLLPKLDIGDYVIFHDTGAYGASMSSNYNSRPLIPEILIENKKFRIIRKRQTFKEMLMLEKI
ncbi:Diaminopimelate decarboxylase [Buchnera aphidicola (Tetraneura ulmi)]|uniref:diaminopimelate decarboxylase n=1 Tax=Buchnera aphidicola TaxID=9 RepID=UPI003464981E